MDKAELKTANPKTQLSSQPRDADARDGARAGVNWYGNEKILRNAMETTLKEIGNDTAYFLV